MKATPTTTATATAPLGLLQGSKSGSQLAERLAIPGRRRLRERHPGEAERYGNQCSEDSFAHTLFLS
jgi:hypothetical protein